jgi:hypothetical protein
MAGQENGVSLSLLDEQIYWIEKAAHEERPKLGTIASLPKTLIACGMIPLHPVLVRGKMHGRAGSPANGRTGADEPRRLSRKMNLRKTIDRTLENRIAQIHAAAVIKGIN